MNYTINQLRIFLKITQAGSITKAAEELHLTQPAVSIQLRNFQEQFDIPLTEIIGRKLYVTDFGREIALSVERILNEVAAIDHRTHEFKGRLAGRLRISVVSTGKYVMPYFLTGFLRQHEGVELQLDVTNKSKVILSLEGNEVDFSLVSVMPPALKLEKLELMENRLYLIGNSEHEHGLKSHGKTIFRSIPLIYREEGSGTRFVMEQYIASHDIPAVKKLQLTSNEAVKQAVIAGMGYSIMPLIGIKNELETGELKIIPVRGFPIKSMWSLIWLQDKKFSPVADAFFGYIREQKESIAMEKFSWYEKYH